MAPHSSTLAWKIPWMEEPGRLQSMESLGVGHDWTTSLSLFTFIHWRRKWHPLQCSCLENPRDRGAQWAAISGIAQSRTRLKQLSSSSSSSSLVKYLALSSFSIAFPPTMCFVFWCQGFPRLGVLTSKGVNSWMQCQVTSTSSMLGIRILTLEHGSMWVIFSRHLWLHLPSNDWIVLFPDKVMNPGWCFITLLSSWPGQYT